WFGAKGDGAADDAAAVQAAINLASAIAGSVYLPTGAYAIGTELTLPVQGKAIRIRGDAFSHGNLESGSVILPHPSVSPNAPLEALFQAADPGKALRGVELDHLSLAGPHPGAGRLAKCGFRAEHLVMASFHRVSFRHTAEAG